METGIQYEKAMQNRCNANFQIIRVITYQYTTQLVNETFKFKVENTESKDSNLLKDPYLMEIKYREKSASFAKKNKFESRSTQTDFKFPEPER